MFFCPKFPFPAADPFHLQVNENLICCLLVEPSSTCNIWLSFPFSAHPQVNQNLIRCLLVEAPQPEEKLATLSEIAQEHGVEWDLSAAARELLPPEAAPSFVSGGTPGSMVGAAGAGVGVGQGYQPPPFTPAGGAGAGAAPAAVGAPGGGPGLQYMAAGLPPMPSSHSTYTDANQAAAAAAVAAAQAQAAADYAAQFALHQAGLAGAAGAAVAAAGPGAGPGAAAPGGLHGVGSGASSFPGDVGAVWPGVGGGGRGQGQGLGWKMQHWFGQPMPFLQPPILVVLSAHWGAAWSKISPSA